MKPISSFTIRYKEYLITSDKAQLQPEAIQEWLSKESYWAKNISLESVMQCFENSFMIGALFEGKQVANARMVTDYTIFGYVADVYVATNHRGKGLGKEMMAVLMDIDWVKSLRRIMLATADAHGLYKQYGFQELKYPVRMMEINRSGNNFSE